MAGFINLMTTARVVLNGCLQIKDMHQVISNSLSSKDKV